MEQSPSWEAKIFLADQEISRYSWNPKFHYRVCKNPPPFSIHSQISLVHAHKSYFFKMKILFSLPCPDLSRLIFPSGFPTRELHTLLFYTIRATCPTHLTLFFFLQNEQCIVSSPNSEGSYYPAALKFEILFLQKYAFEFARVDLTLLFLRIWM